MVSYLEMDDIDKRAMRAGWSIPVLPLEPPAPRSVEFCGLFHEHDPDIEHDTHPRCRHRSVER